MTLEIRAAMQKIGSSVKIKSLVYGLGGKDFFKEDVWGNFETNLSSEKEKLAQNVQQSVEIEQTAEAAAEPEQTAEGSDNSDAPDEDTRPTGLFSGARSDI